MSRELRAYIDELKTEHAELNKQKSLTKEEKVTKLRLKDKIFELDQQFAEEYWSQRSLSGNIGVKRLVPRL